VVIEDGEIIEQGHHEELLVQRGAYYRLYQSQFRATGDAQSELASVEGEES